MKKVIRLTESDLLRIVKRVIKEDSTTPFNVPQIQGFLWAEDDKNWLASLGHQPSAEELSKENGYRIGQYYGSQPEGKIALLFRNVADFQKYGYAKQNVLPQIMFNINNIEVTNPPPTTSMKNTTTVYAKSGNGFTTPFVRLMWSPSGKAFLQFFKSNGSDKVDVKNPVLHQILIDKVKGN